MNRSQTLSFVSRLDGWLSIHEGFFLYEAVRKSKGKGEIVEIGSWKGKSTVCLAAGSKAGQKTKIIAVDPHKGEYTKNNAIGKKSPTFKEFKKNLREAGISSCVKPFLVTSKKASVNWRKPIRFLFIDGLHDYKNTTLDYASWSPFVRDSGVIAFHDAFCGHVGPERVVREILKKEWKNIGVVGSIIYFQKGKPKNFIQRLNILRHKVLIPIALKINKQKISDRVKFFLIHRLIKLLLLNEYTFLLQFEKE